MSDIPSRDALRTAVVAAAWTEVFINDATADAILDAILPLVLAGAGRRPGVDAPANLRIVCGNADWDGEKVCPTCSGKGYVDG